MLAAAMPEPVSVKEMWLSGLTNVHAHIESLRMEGHFITQVKVLSKGPHGDEFGWKLDYDAWKSQRGERAVLDDVEVRTRMVPADQTARETLFSA